MQTKVSRLGKDHRVIQANEFQHDDIIRNTENSGFAIGLHKLDVSLKRQI